MDVPKLEKPLEMFPVNSGHVRFVERLAVFSEMGPRADLEDHFLGRREVLFESVRIVGDDVDPTAPGVAARADHREIVAGRCKADLEKRVGKLFRICQVHILEHLKEELAHRHGFLIRDGEFVFLVKMIDGAAVAFGALEHKIGSALKAVGKTRPLVEHAQ